MLEVMHNDRYLNLLAKGICTDTPERNQELVMKFWEMFPTLTSIKNMTDDERRAVLSWGPEMRCLLAAMALGQLVLKGHREILGHAYSSMALGREMIDYFLGEDQEGVTLACTDVHNEIIDLKTLFVGGQSECVLYPDRIFSYALRRSASGIIMIHNHPSGDVHPSAQDLAFAKRLDRGSRLLGLRLLDFMIVGQDRYYSWREKQQVRPEK